MQAGNVIQENINKINQKKTIINITYKSNNKNSILYLNELINKIISNKFNDTNLSIYIKNNDKIKSMIFKEKSSSKVSIYMVDWLNNKNIV